VRKVAEGEKTVVVVPVIRNIVEVEVALVSVAPEVRDVAVAIAVRPNRRAVPYRTPSLSLPLEYSQSCIGVREFAPLVRGTKFLHRRSSGVCASEQRTIHHSDFSRAPEFNRPQP